MTSKKNTKNVKSSALRKSTPRKTKAAPKDHLVEKKLESVMESSHEHKTTTHTKKKTHFPWWGLFSLLLVLVFGTILLYEYNRDFKNNFAKMVSSTGLVKMGDNVPEETAKEPFLMKMNIVYNKDDAKMKQTIEQYLQNIEKNLINTKVSATWMDKNAPNAQAIIEKLDSKFLPIFTTDSDIQKHPQYSLFAAAITVKNGEYQFQSEGMEYLKTPDVADARFIGAAPEKAKVKVIEYVSMSCGYCKAMHPILQNIAKNYGDRVSIIIKNYDRGGIDSILGQALECTADQGRLDQMITAMFNHQADIFTAMQAPEKAEEAVYEQMKAAAKEAGANGDTMLTCVKSGKYADKISKQTIEGQEFGVIGTPGFFINNKFIGGAMEEGPFTKLIEDELNK
jgi:protein-disulfide isomerase